MALSLLPRARQTLNQAVARYSAALQGSSGDQNGHVSAVKTGLGQMESLTAKLDSRCLKVAVFGLVSRGKSAVINALIGEPLLDTGPCHGVTRWPRSVYWQPPLPGEGDQVPWQIELIDTPGLDEVGGDIRSDMAQAVARQADLILFVVAGEMTRQEYLALLDLWQQHKPLLLVFNKVDLYPDLDRQAIYTNLQQLCQSLGQTPAPAPPVVDGVVMVAADPAPWPVRTEWPDGRVTETWEKPPAQMEPLRQALLTLVTEEGTALVTLNALRSARQIESALVSHVSQLHRDRADAIIWEFAKYKALAVALNPVAGLDLLGGAISDLMMIRCLAQVYGLPLTNHQVGQLWKALLKSSGVLVVSQLGSGLLGAGKTTAALVSLVDSASGVTALVGAMTAQASAAGYGTYAVGKATQTYLEQGCSWGPEGISATLQQVLQETGSAPTLARLRQDIATTLSPS